MASIFCSPPIEVWTTVLCSSRLDRGSGQQHCQRPTQHPALHIWLKLETPNLVLRVALSKESVTLNITGLTRWVAEQ